MTNEEFIEGLAAAPNAEARHDLLNRYQEFLQLNTIYALKERADRLKHDDANRALNVGLAAEEAAEVLSSDEARAVALWTKATAYRFLANLDTAVSCYERAAALFKASGKPLDAARTCIGEMSALMNMGQFDRAQAIAETARGVFVKHGDIASQAKIDMNLGNLYYREGQYQQALVYFQHATRAFQTIGDNLYAAMNQVNEANMLTFLDDFLKAEELHEQARPTFEAADLRSAAASVDHDLAFLKYARGNYNEAFRTFERARDIFTDLSNKVNIAQTDLEESDLYLDLNLPGEALRLATQAEVAFKEIGIPFELAWARSNHAVALARLGQGERSAALLEEVRGLFISQGNVSWVAHTDLQRAEILGQKGQREQARLLAVESARAYKKLGMKTKLAYAHILIANLWADEHQWKRSLKELQVARNALIGLTVPWLEQRIEACAGRTCEGMGQTEEAISHYKEAADKSEQMASTLTAEEQRTAFVADKLAPYEALVTLYTTNKNAGEAFQWAEQAKSRALADSLAAGVRPRLLSVDGKDTRKLKRLQDIREELNWLYSRVTRGAAPGKPGAPAAGPDTWVKIQECEQEATSLWRELQGRHAEKLSFIKIVPLTPADIQSKLPESTALVEYFIGRDQITAFVLLKDKIQVYPDLTSVSDLRFLMEKLAFQFSKFQYGQDYYDHHKSVMIKSTQNILDQLGQKLLEPLWDELSASKSVIIIPHGLLHALPFHALRLNNHYLIETHTISYAPSAAVLKFCWNKVTPDRTRSPAEGRPLLVGVQDELTSQVVNEIQALGKLLPDAEILINQKATLERIRQSAPTCSLFHLAAHGLFRPDAPLLSSIHLADQWMAVQDVYDLELRASLVTLSACETGLGHDAGGDDLMGLVRGFLYAGASSLVVSLWMVDDESMTHLMTEFYTHWLSGDSKARSLRQAQLDLIENYEHPYFWAPLVLVGDEK